MSHNPAGLDLADSFLRGSAEAMLRPQLQKVGQIIRPWDKTQINTVNSFVNKIGFMKEVAKSLDYLHYEVMPHGSSWPTRVQHHGGLQILVLLHTSCRHIKHPKTVARCLMVSQRFLHNLYLAHSGTTFIHIPLGAACEGHPIRGTLPHQG